jgi:hypothetical protein
MLYHMRDENQADLLPLFGYPGAAGLPIKATRKTENRRNFGPIFGQGLLFRVAEAPDANERAV